MAPVLRNRWVVFGMCQGFILGLGVVDSWTGFELDLFLFYALPVALIAWAVGRGWAVLTALVAVIVWHWANLLGAGPYSSAFYKYWKATLQFGWLLLVALMVARIRTDLDRELKQLRGLLPICGLCKKIRTDEGYWEEVDTYLRNHTEARFSHGVCPICLKAQGADVTGGQR